MTGLAGADLLGAGISHACAWDGTDMWCWGDNSFGELGNGEFGFMMVHDTPVRVECLP